MIRDPFYQDIIQGLNGRLDPELFEQCAGEGKVYVAVMGKCLSNFVYEHLPYLRLSEDPLSPSGS